MRVILKIFCYRYYLFQRIIYFISPSLGIQKKKNTHKKHALRNKASNTKFRTFPALMYILSVHKRLKTCSVLKQYTHSTYTQLHSICWEVYILIKQYKILIIIKFSTIAIDGVNFATIHSFRIRLICLLIRNLWLPTHAPSRPPPANK